MEEALKTAQSEGITDPVELRKRMVEAGERAKEIAQ
jgi:hypothetical protein